MGYFSELTRDEFDAVYQRFKIDFEMFDYSAEEYFALSFEGEKT